MSEIVLYDYACQGTNRCWSYNVWKTRMVLNYKSLPYRTEWVDSDSLAPTLSALGLPPNDVKEGGGFEYTVPTVRFQNGDAVMDSDRIAREIEARFPAPSLGLDPELEKEVDGLIHAMVMPLFANYMPRVVKMIVRPESLGSFLAPREKGFGMSVEEMERVKGGEQAWEAAAPLFADLAAWVKRQKKDEGPFVLGSRVCYADFLVAPVFHAIRLVGDDMFERAVGLDPCFRELYDACEPWFRRNQ